MKNIIKGNSNTKIHQNTNNRSKNLKLNNSHDYIN